jgi:imidazolonepropionase-like amidohydrolase
MKSRRPSFVVRPSSFIIRRPSFVVHHSSFGSQRSPTPIRPHVHTPILTFALLVLSIGFSGAQSPGTILIRNATVLTVSHGTIENGSILIQDGKIADVGRDIAAPAGAEVVDATGMYLVPGIIDCHSHIAVDGGVNEGTLSVTAMVGVGDVLNPTDINIYRDLAGGVTTANVLHGSANAIGGKNQVIKLRWGKDAEGLKFAKAPPGIKFALGENPRRVPSGTTPGATRRYPATRMGVEDVIRDAFNRARQYTRSWDEYRAKKQKGAPAMPPRRDLELEPLVEVLQGKRLVHCHCYRADEILMLIRLADEFGFKIATFQHVLEGYKVAKEIAAHGAGASTFSDWWAFKIEAYDAIPYNAAIMTRKGVVVSINSDSAEEARHLNQEAAKCVKYGGLSEQEALALVTLNPAKQLRIEQRVGSIDRGKDADLVLYNRHPFSTLALPQKVWIDGALYFDREKDRARQQEIAELKRKLKAEDGTAETQSTQRPDRESGDCEGDGGHSPDGVSAPGSVAAVSARPSATILMRPDVYTFIFPELLCALRVSAVKNGLYAIRNARIYPVSGPVIESGTVLIDDGKIADVGANVAIPSGAQVIEGSGLRIYPGMIDANTTIGLTEIGSIIATVDASEIGNYNPQLRAYDAFHTESEHIPVTRVNGITTCLSHPTGGVFSGQAALVNLDGWTVEEMAVRKSVGMALSLPRLSARREFDPETLSIRQRPYSEAKRDYDARVRELAELLDQARHYLQAKEAYAKDSSLPALRFDEKLEALIPVVRGEMPVLVFASGRTDIKNAVEFAEKQKLKIVIMGGAEAGKIAGYLKEKDVPVIYGPVLSLPTEEDDPYDLPYATPGILAKAGVRFAIASADTSDSRNLPYDAGNAAGSGLSEEEALKAITLYPAQLLGVADRLGSIEKGKVANLVITDGSLLEIPTQVRHVFINGRPVSLESRHTRLYERYVNRP